MLGGQLLNGVRKAAIVNSKYINFYLLLIYFIFITEAAAGNSNFKEIRNARPCVDGPAITEGYLNSSFHGAWLSDTINSWRSGVSLEINRDSSDPSIASIKKYMYTPAMYMNYSFRAVFYGRIKCLPKRVPAVFVVDKAMKIKISRYRNAR